MKQQSIILYLRLEKKKSKRQRLSLQIPLEQVLSAVRRLARACGLHCAASQGPVVCVLFRCLLLFRSSLSLSLLSSKSFS